MKNRRPEHTAVGEPCSLCGMSAFNHRIRPQRKRRDYRSIINGGPGRAARIDQRNVIYGGQGRSGRKDNRKFTRIRADRVSKRTYIGIDGEGTGRFPHNYVFLAASTKDGDESWTAEMLPGNDRLTTEQCLDFILELPYSRDCKVFSYAFNYDLTKILTDLDEKSLFEIFRPDLPHRRGKFGPSPIHWKGRNDTVYSLNLQGTKFTVAANGKKVIVWDLFKFFQSKFVISLQDWKVGDEFLWKRMSEMKDKRGVVDQFWDKDPEAVKKYCLEETRCMAELAEKLITAHEDAGLKLKTFYGAGSSGAAMLNVMGIKAKLVPTPPAMKDAVASSYFGGRFEESIIGPVEEKLYAKDISSAYVYGLTQLPCLEHARWERTRRRKDIEDAKTALVRYSLGSLNHMIQTSWAPFPFRTEDGSICFPAQSGGGWIWKDEYLQGEQHFPNVRFHEAWIHNSDCDCKPFAKIPEYYILRLQIGKEGPGIVIKLGMNSCYGKLTQSVGNAIFNNWIWAAMITSKCRAQLLEILGLHADMANCLMFATDGVVTREKIQSPVPLPTGTGLEIMTPDGPKCKPLGGWEDKDKDYELGAFFARPGIYFPLEPTEEKLKYIRARGVGRSTVLQNWKAIVKAWETDGTKGIAHIANVSRFCGGKTSISKSQKGYRRATSSDGIHPAYGEWISRRIEMSFDPMPKRERVAKDGKSLILRKFPKDMTSSPYRKSIAMLNKEAMEMAAMRLELEEQPDCDLSEYDLEVA